MIDAARSGWLGVLGGMGPLATIDFMSKVVAHTPAQRDQDHIPMLVICDPTVPDRTTAIHGHGEDPWPGLLRGAQQLAAAGVDVAAIPCNSAHHWFARLSAAVPLRWLHIADAAGRALGQIGLKSSGVGLLATSGTVASGMYVERLSSHAIKWILPTREEQDTFVDAGVRAVKAGQLAQAARLLADAEKRLVVRGAGALLMACTEIPLALADVPQIAHVPRIDATDALAQWCVAELRGGKMSMST